MSNTFFQEGSEKFYSGGEFGPLCPLVTGLLPLHTSNEQLQGDPWYFIKTSPSAKKHNFRKSNFASLVNSKVFEA